MKLTACFAFLAIAALPQAQANEALAQKGGCVACHTKDKKLIGPSFQEISGKYKGQKDAEVKLFDKVRKGSTGTWGTLAMPPSGADKISDADLKSLLQWIVKGA